ncbi:hypothetical protein J5226_05565 [Lysobacter sp. K5869]|uniref:DUF6683 family protein n=1 Tax=Lysobacter sp. K5869 TaxID=2820808 RepID=UPI001C0606A0|nr:DUF6683 family protein [Lysobacter sp. K5869]QWP77873.1 hypothetical protein J5226_05565 [Lysobacter sp. K5869]
MATTKTLAAAIALLGACAPAGAQDYQPYMDSFNSTMTSMQNTAGTAAVNAAINRSLSQRGKSAAPAAKPAAKAAATADLSFRRDPATTERVRAALIAAMGKQSRGVADDFARRSGGADYRRRFAATLPARGLSNDNLADVAAYHVAVNWALVHQAALPSAASLRALREQMRGSFADNGVLAQLAPAQRQWVADDFLFRSLNLDEKVEQFARAPDPQTQAAFARAAREDIRRTLGLDLQDYRFTAAGLVR